MSLMKGDGGKRAKAILMASIISTAITTQTMEVIEYNQQVDIEHTKDYEKEKALREEYRNYREVEEKEFEKIATEMYEKVKYEQEEAERMKDYTYRTIKELKAKTGLNVVGFQEINITITFYGDTYEQNGGYPNITCTGAKLVQGMVASNVYPLGTKIEWEGKVYTVSDRGGSHFDSPHRLDVFVPRYSGEDDDEYIARIYGYGKRTVEATILQIGK